MHHTDATYYFGKPRFDGLGWPDEYVPRVSELAKRLYCISKAYGQHKPNYEDIYYLVWQLYAELSPSKTNPAILPFKTELEKSAQDLLEKRPYDNTTEWRFSYLICELKNYMECVVWRLLAKPTENTSHLEFISKIHTCNVFKLGGILTLNHDRALETFMKQWRIPFFNGFAPEVGGPSREWIGFRSFDSKGEGEDRIPLVKLHGSIVWFHFKNTDKGSLKLREVGLCDDIWNLRDDEGRLNPADQPVDGTPEILMGRANKLQSYNFGHYIELYSVCQKILYGTDALIVVGYGFGDTGVDATIRSWLDEDESHRLVIVAPRIEEQIEEMLRIRWIKRRIAKNAQIQLISECIQDVDFAEIKDLLLA